jgi:hypothetical protein
LLLLETRRTGDVTEARKQRLAFVEAEGNDTAEVRWREGSYGS